MAITSRLHWIFASKRGIRPGWRFAIFVALYVACGPLFNWFLPKVHFPDRAMDWFSMLMNEALDFVLAAVFTLMLCRIERSRFSSFGLKAGRDSARLLGRGVVWGVAPPIAILIPIWAAGACSFHGWALEPRPLLGYAALWALAFLAVGIHISRIRVTDAREGIGFWPAAAVMSGLFGFLHFLKPDDGWIDPISVALYGLFWCFTLQRTGGLWFAIGFQAASDYTDMVVFVEPNTGDGGPACARASSECPIPRAGLVDGRSARHRGQPAGFPDPGGPLLYLPHWKKQKHRDS